MYIIGTAHISTSLHPLQTQCFPILTSVIFSSSSSPTFGKRRFNCAMHSCCVIASFARTLTERWVGDNGCLLQTPPSDNLAGPEPARKIKVPKTQQGKPADKLTNAGVSSFGAPWPVH